MKNSTNIKIPKKFHSMIDEMYEDQDGYWCHVANGYYASGMDGYDVCHTIHEDDIPEFLRQIKLIKPL